MPPRNAATGRCGHAAAPLTAGGYGRGGSRAQLLEPLRSLTKLQVEKHIPPYAAYELGAMAFTRGAYVDARELLREAERRHADYDLENRLSMQIHAAMRRVEECLAADGSAAATA